jgi:hypothetical protein
LAGEIEVLEENMHQCHFVHHKPHMLCPDANPGRHGGKTTNRFSYGTAIYECLVYTDLDFGGFNLGQVAIPEFI